MSTGAGRATEAVWVVRMGVWGVRALVVVLVLALVFTMVNVAGFAAAGHPVGSFEWWIAWLLDPMASITMGTAIVFEGLLAGYGRAVGWLTATKWYAGGCTWAMNVWDSLASGSVAGVVLHSVAPGLVLLLAEAAPRVRREMTEIVTGLRDKPPGQSAQPARDHREPVELPQAHRWVPPVAPTGTAPAPVPPSERAEPLDSDGLPAGVRAPVDLGPLPRREPCDAAPLHDAGPEGEGPSRPALPAEPGTGQDTLVDRVRDIVAQTASEGKPPGRRTVARQLGITEHQARCALELVGATTTRPHEDTSTAADHDREETQT